MFIIYKLFTIFILTTNIIMAFQIKNYKAIQYINELNLFRFNVAEGDTQNKRDFVTNVVTRNEREFYQEIKPNLVNKIIDSLCEASIKCTFILQTTHSNINDFEIIMFKFLNHIISEIKIIKELKKHTEEEQESMIVETIRYSTFIKIHEDNEYTSNLNYLPDNSDKLQNHQLVCKAMKDNRVCRHLLIKLIQNEYIRPIYSKIYETDCKLIGEILVGKIIYTIIQMSNGSNVYTNKTYPWKASKILISEFSLEGFTKLSDQMVSNKIIKFISFPIKLIILLLMNNDVRDKHIYQKDEL